jgi:hypothetical protein
MTSIEEQTVKDYISQLGEKEKIAFEIAKNHLGTSFSLKKSIGYKEWLKEYLEKNEKSKDQKEVNH